MRLCAELEPQRQMGAASLSPSPWPPGAVRWSRRREEGQEEGVRSQSRSRSRAGNELRTPAGEAAHLSSCSAAHQSPQPRFRVSPAFPRAATSLARCAARNDPRALRNFPASAAGFRAGLTWRLRRKPIWQVQVQGPRGLHGQSPRPPFKNQGNRCWEQKYGQRGARADTQMSGRPGPFSFLHS